MVGQTGGVVGRSVGLLRVNSVVWVESMVEEEGSVPEQSNIMLALPADAGGCCYSQGQTEFKRSHLHKDTYMKPPKYSSAFPWGFVSLTMLLPF